MKYYSENLKKFFNSEDECKQAEAAANAEKETYEAEMADLEKQLEKAAAAVDKKRKEAEAKQAELDKLLQERADIAKKITDKRLEYMSKDPLKRAYKIKTKTGYFKRNHLFFIIKAPMRVSCASYCIC